MLSLSLSYLILVGMARHFLQVSHEELEGVIVSRGELEDQLLQAAQSVLIVRFLRACHKIIVEVGGDSRVGQLLEELLEQAADSVDVSVV